MDPEERLDYLFGLTRNRVMHYFLLVLPSGASSDLDSTLRVECYIDNRRINFQRKEFKEAIADLWERSFRVSEPYAYAQSAATAPTFILRYDQIIQYESVPLRKFMGPAESIRARGDLFKEFKVVERTMLLYELAECALLFLRTGLLGNLCSCCLFRSKDARYNVRISTPPRIAHMNPETGEIDSTEKWCETNLAGVHEHFRRLGVLIVEIAVGAPVREAALNEQTNEVEIKFEAKDIPTGAIPASSLGDIEEKVQAALNYAAADAVRHCFGQTTPSDQISFHDLNSFYDSVVGP